MAELCGVHIPETKDEALQPGSGWRSLGATIMNKVPLAGCHLERDPKTLQPGQLCHAVVHSDGAAATYVDSDHFCTIGYWRDLPAS
jgi:hypothetical protein